MDPSSPFESSWLAVKELTKHFQSNEAHYLSNEYQEAHVRKDFIDKLFKAIGWDVDHDSQRDPYKQEVKIEKSEKKAKGRADYSFSIAPHFKRIRFFVEAKRPQANICTPDNCFQAIRYCRPKNISIAMLTDFNNIYVIDSRFKPNIETSVSRVVKQWNHKEFETIEKFSEFYYLFSREAVASGSIENFAENELPTPKAATRQYSLLAGDTKEFDDDFLEKMDEWRESLARYFKKTNNELTGEQLTECVQRTLDRLIFIRFIEDKQIEQESIITKFGLGKKTHWQDFVSACRRLDQIYNGVVFKEHSILDSTNFFPESSAFSDICDEITDDHSPYNFDAIPVEMLGRIYERFLGKIVQAKAKSVSVVEKADVRKAGGVFYTPDYIVGYIVDQSLGALIKGKTPDEMLKIRSIDTACGSGSFLIGVFDYLIQAMTAYYRKFPKEAIKKGMLETRDGEYYLSLSFKREILLHCIYGVDIDAQAVEVAQLSLYLKLMEQETTYSSHQQQLEMGVALLPSLSKNIVVGNSLVTLDDDMFSREKLIEKKSLDFGITFKSVFKEGGFDLVIGNPPYIKEYTNREAFDDVRDSPYYEGKMDLWYMFACRGLDWLKQDTGILAYIATNNWVTNAGAKKLRAKITEKTRIAQLVDFGDFKVFRDAGIQTMILIVYKSNTPESYTFDYRKIKKPKPVLLDAQNLLEHKATDGLEYLSPSINRARDITSPLTFSSSNLETILDNIASKRNFELDGRSEVAQGIVAPQDFVNKNTAEKLGSNFYVGQGIFNITTKEKSNLNLTKEEESLIKPFYTTVELGKYYGHESNKLWVIYTDSRFKNKNEIKPYPAIKAHLDQFLSVITSDNYPYGLHRARNEYFFTGEKIISLRKCTEPCFTYTDFPCYVSQTYNVIKTNRVNMKYLTALLNSKVIKFWLRHKGKMQGQLFQIDKEPLLALPLCAADEQVQTNIAKIVDKILDCKKSLAKAKTETEKEQLERLIEQYDEKIQDFIFNLYSLTQDEITLINEN